MSRIRPIHAILFSFLFLGAVLLSFLLLPQHFSDLTMKLFRQELSGNTLNLHYTLADPAAFGITESNVSFGSFSADPTPEQTAALTAWKEKFLSYHPARLTKEEQHTQKILAWWLDGQLALTGLSSFQEPLNPTHGTQIQLPILLAEFPFRSSEDIECYLSLLELLPSYFAQIADLEQEKAEKGRFMAEESLLKVLEQCTSFSQADRSHFLITTFQERMQDCSFLTSDEQIVYEIQNEKQFFSSVIPAYQQLAAALEQLRPYCSKPQGLAQIPGGLNYFQWLLTYEIGTERSIPEILDLLEDQIASNYETILHAVQNGVNLPQILSASNTEKSDPEQLLASLEDQIASDFPAVPEVSFQIRQVPTSLSDCMSPAFYLTPPIDLPQQNIIYLNDSNSLNTQDLLPTLAHEGYPGHLYQNTFESSLSPVRSLVYAGGYTEGWGLYSELYAYQYLDLPKETASALRSLSSLNYAICAVLDLEVHSAGWDEQDCTVYLSSFGIHDADQIHTLYLSITEDPANYLKYVLGFLEICKLKECAETHSPALSVSEFHQWFLEYGPAPFSILQDDLQETLEFFKIAS